MAKASLQNFRSNLEQSENLIFQDQSDLINILSKKRLSSSKNDFQKKPRQCEKDLYNAVSNYRTASQDQILHQEDLKKDLEIFELKKSSIGKQISLYEEEMAQLQKQERVLKDVPVVDHHQKTRSLELEDSLFRKYLALDVKKVKGNHLQFVFTNIDDKNPERIYSFTLGIDENRQYLVSSVEPAITDLEDLLDTLNSTNDLDKFVHTIRRRFKNLIKS